MGALRRAGHYAARVARRKAKEATEGYLERVALWYLGRYPGSVARVRAALNKRVRRSVKELDSDPEQGARNVEAVIARLKDARLLDDARFAASRVRVLRRRGNSARAIGAALRRQGIAPGVIEQALSEEAEEGASELSAARQLARRKRLGVHRPEDKRDEHRRKDLAKLARAGFSYGVAKAALDGPGDE